MIYLQQKKKQKSNGRSHSYFAASGHGDADRMHKKVVKRLRAELIVSFAVMLS